jgi:mono/diheme cytochrome c family protein
VQIVAEKIHLHKEGRTKDPSWSICKGAGIAACCHRLPPGKGGKDAVSRFAIRLLFGPPLKQTPLGEEKMKRSLSCKSLLLSVLWVFTLALSGCDDGSTGPPGPPGPPGQNPTTQLPSNPEAAERVVFYVDDRGTPEAADDVWQSHFQRGLGETAAGDLPETSDAFARRFRAELIEEDGQIFLQLTNLVGEETTARYPVLLTYGGEGNYKQRYVVTLPNHDSKFIAPLQFNDQAHKHPDGLASRWVGYNPQHWYNTATNALRTPPNSAAFDGECAGCHFTGYTLQRNNRGQEVAEAGFLEQEINGQARSFVGSTRCLSCHGDMVNWGQTLHKLVLRQPLQFSLPQARGAELYADTINRGIKLLLGMIDEESTPSNGVQLQEITPLRAITRADPFGVIDFDGDGQLDEINIGCERCHGPGSEHVRTLDAGDIINPANLRVNQANMVCGQCHIRGLSRETFTDHFAEASEENPARAPFPARIGANGEVQTYVLGEDLNDYFIWDAGENGVQGLDAGRFAGQYWGGEPSGGNFVAGRMHRQQYIDMLQGAHGQAVRCFDCHDMHDNRSPTGFQVVTARRGGVNGNGPVIKVSDDDNTLCLSCHAGLGPFADITLDEVADVSLNGPSANLRQVVMAHTQHTYNPQGEGEDPVFGHPQSELGNQQTSRCSGCHMPYTARTALDWDIRSHTFQVIRPEASLSDAPAAGVPNSCNHCHGGTTDEELQGLQQAFTGKFLDAQGQFAPGEGANAIFNQWLQSGHGDAESPAFNYAAWLAAGSIPVTCARCHSTDGFIDFAQDGTVDAPAPTGQVVSCEACHTQGTVPAFAADASTRWDDREQHPALEPVRFPSGAEVTLEGPSNICMGCHQGRASKVQVDEHIAANPADLRFVNIHYYAAAATVFGSEVQGGYEYDGQTYRGRNTFPAHPPELQVCTGCHMPDRNGVADHTFLPQIQDCNICHPGNEFTAMLGSPTINSQAIQTLKGELEELLAASGVTLLPNFPYFQNLTTAEQLRAAYNWQVADKDPCGYIHNGLYIQQLLHDSIADMGGTPSIIPPERTPAEPPPTEPPPTEPPPTEPPPTEPPPTEPPPTEPPPTQPPPTEPPPTQPPAGDVAAGQTVYDAECAGCHRLGTYDANGFAADLAGTQASARFPTPGPGTGVHAGITLDAAELANLQAFIDAQSP